MKVILATDGSESSEGAARFLTRFRFTPADEIAVLHVVPGVPFRHAGEPYSAALMQLGEEIAPGIIDATAGMLKGLRATISTAVTTGHPADAILDVAAQSGSDLIVLGHRRGSGFGPLLLGSTARAVAIASLRPVLVVKPSQGRPFRPVNTLFATDGSECSKETEKLLVSLPFPEDAGMTAVYASPSTYLEVPDRFYMELDERVKKITENLKGAEMKFAGEVLERAREALKARFGKVTIITAYGEPSEQILRTAKEMRADIIALGSRGMRGVRGMLGSVARNILGHAECSVLICKAKHG